MQTAQFRAHYFGNPEPRVAWVRNGLRLRPDGERVLVRTYSGESTLVVRDLRADDSGKYEVLIENEVGCDAASASLGVEGPPEPPAGRPFVSAVDVSRTPPCLTLAWYGSTFDGGSCVTGYVVEAASWPSESPAGAPERPDWEVLEPDCKSTSYIVEGGLAPGREFIFRVRVRDAAFHFNRKYALLLKNYFFRPPTFTEPASPAALARRSASRRTPTTSPSWWW